MKVLILGGSGMLGHKLYQVLSGKLDVYVTLRKNFEYYEKFGIFKRENSICNLDISDIGNVRRSIEEVRPDAIVNCIGLIKQKQIENFETEAVKINSVFPQHLEKLCEKQGVRLIQISTDCVFKGDKGNYNEEDITDADDIYGMSKFLGEVKGKNSLTLRTSIIGRELESQLGLLEWFFSQKGQNVKGFSKAIYTGMTTRAFAKVILKIILEYKDLTGLYHVSGDKISKYDLLNMFKKKLDLDIEIEKDEAFIKDMSLDSSKLNAATGIKVASWEEQIDEFAELDH